MSPLNGDKLENIDDLYDHILPRSNILRPTVIKIEFKVSVLFWVRVQRVVATHTINSVCGVMIMKNKYVRIGFTQAQKNEL